ncbi:MAG TPA: metallopeptidase TldD-related protein [Acidisarcina sp.]|nr:metallopeptidase TldD-related protein [Acidisarcina sp.]
MRKNDRAMHGRVLVAAIAAITLCVPAYARHASHTALAQKDVSATGPGAAETHQDPVLEAMLAELHRSQQQLQLQNFQRPFFLQYRLDDVDNYEASANYGAVTGERRDHRRLVRVTVRVGDYQMDSSQPHGDGSLQVAAIEDDPVALRIALWSATDIAYKAALRDYTRKQVALKAYQTQPSAQDFSREKPLVSMGSVVRLDLATADWQKTIADASGVYRSRPSFEKVTEYSASTIHARAVNRYLVNTEGTVVRHGSAVYQARISVGTQAPDGMRMDRSYETTGTSAAQLDSAAQFHSHVEQLLASLEELRKAPVVDEVEYHGPVLFTGNSGGDIFSNLFAPGVVAIRPDLGTEARTKGPYAASYRARVLPEGTTVVDDPRMDSFAGEGLIGAYDVDDEGVPAQPVDVVENGKLTSYLLGRAPVRDFAVSNGHGRAGLAEPPRPEIGVLRVESTKAVSPEELNAKLLAMARERGLDSVYVAEALGPELSPRMLYRIHVADGTRQLVRGAAFDDLDQRSLRSNISAVGSDTQVSNFLGETPTTVLAPSLLFDDITVKRANDRNDKLPYYPPPE